MPYHGRTNLQKKRKYGANKKIYKFSMRQRDLLMSNAKGLSEMNDMYNYLDTARSTPDEGELGQVRIFNVPDTYLEEIGVPTLPHGYGYSSGVARTVALKLWGMPSPQIRDLDVVAIAEHQPDMSYTDGISRTLMPDDYLYRHSVQLTTLEKYMNTRDFTMNEVLVADGVLYASDRAVHDLQASYIRPTEHESQLYPQSGVCPKLAAKAILMSIVLGEVSGEASIRGVNWSEVEIDEFHHALALNKAAQHGSHIAQRYIQRSGLGHEADNASDIVGVMLALAEDVDFEFRGSELADRAIGDIYDEVEPDVIEPEDPMVDLWWSSGKHIIGSTERISDHI